MARKKAAKIENPPADAPADPVLRSPLIFISHDTRDADLADAFAKLISGVSCGMLKTFRSSDRQGSQGQGIEYGLEWYPHIMEKLDDSSRVVCLLTERSVNRPWILYEAGVAKGKLDTPVLGIALGITLSQANTGPFAQFQNCEDNSDSLTGLIMQLLTLIPNSEPDKEIVRAQVATFIEKKAELLSKLGAPPKSKDESHDASIAKLFEEVKLIVQDLPTKLEGRLAEAALPLVRRRNRKFSPMLLEEMLFMSMDREGSSVGILIFFSFYKDEVPWLYDLGMKFYEAVKARHLEKASELIREMTRGVEIARRHGYREEAPWLSKDLHHLGYELPRLLDGWLHASLREADERIKPKGKPAK